MAPRRQPWDWSLDIWGSHLECAGLTALCWPAAWRSPDWRREQKLPTNVSPAFRRQNVTKRAFQKRSKLFRSSFGGAVKPAPMKAASSRRTARSRDRCRGLKMSNLQIP